MVLTIPECLRKVVTETYLHPPNEDVDSEDVFGLPPSAKWQWRRVGLETVLYARAFIPESEGWRPWRNHLHESEHECAPSCLHGSPLLEAGLNNGNRSFDALV